MTLSQHESIQHQTVIYGKNWAIITDIVASDCHINDQDDVCFCVATGCSLLAWL